MNATLIITDLTTGKQYRVECPFTEEEITRVDSLIFRSNVQSQYTLYFVAIEAEYEHLKSQS